MLLKMLEQLLEALPQACVSGAYFYLEHEGEFSLTIEYMRTLYNTSPKQVSISPNNKSLYFYLKVVSLIFSVGSILIFIINNVYQMINDWDNSFFGLIGNLKEGSGYSKVHSEDIELKAKEGHSLLITGMSKSTDGLEIVKLIISNGLPADKAASARMNDGSFTVDDLDYKTCQEMVEKLDNIELNCQTLIVKGIISPKTKVTQTSSRRVSNRVNPCSQHKCR